MSETRFTCKLLTMLSAEQSEFLDAEVLRRKQAGTTSEVPAARGDNRNVNKGMLVREALEAHFAITPKG